ncbi:MAG TPA: alpha/beta hydrolase [Actinospica sp.]|nr:alpha/beta hydrolase [Actinospica sp.]
MRIPEQYAHPEPTTRLQVASADGTRISVEVHGPDGAPTVVLIHGWTCNTTFWAPVIKALRTGAPELRVVAYDQRGHGGSEAPRSGGYSVPILVEDLTAVLDATLPDGERAVLVGHSMGGMTVLACGGNEAVLARTGGAVLCSTGFRLLPGSSKVVPGLARLPRANRAAHRLLLSSPLPIGPVTRISRAMLKHTALGPKADRRLQDVNANMIAACLKKPRAAWGRVLSELDVSVHVGRLDVPTSLVFGTSDRLTPPFAHAQAIADALPDFAGLTILQGIGHMTPMEAPDAVASLIRDRADAMRQSTVDTARLPQQREPQQDPKHVAQQTKHVAQQSTETEGAEQ